MYSNPSSLQSTRLRLRGRQGVPAAARSPCNESGLHYSAVLPEYAPTPLGDQREFGTGQSGPRRDLLERRDSAACLVLATKRGGVTGRPGPRRMFHVKHCAADILLVSDARPGATGTPRDLRTDTEAHCAHSPRDTRLSGLVSPGMGRWRTVFSSTHATAPQPTRQNRGRRTPGYRADPRWVAVTR